MGTNMAGGGGVAHRGRALILVKEGGPLPVVILSEAKEP